MFLIMATLVECSVSGCAFSNAGKSSESESIIFAFDNIFSIDYNSVGDSKEFLFLFVGNMMNLSSSSEVTLVELVMFD